MENYIPILIMFGIALVFSGLFLSLSKLFGPNRPTIEKTDTYECGSPVRGSTRERFSVKFFLVAMLFIIFDIEIVFMYPWAVIYLEGLKNGMGHFLLIEMIFFFVVLNLGLFFAWRKKTLNWN